MFKFIKINKTTQWLLLISIIAVIFDLVRGDLLGKTGILYLVWNLFLAWIPYIISLCFIKKEMPIKRFIPIFIIWLLFFPNAPYLATDVLHIVSRNSPLLWYDSLLFFFFGWIGLLLGMLSLSHMHQYIKNHFSFWLSELSIFLICFLASFGIYLGRFERWNSWDVFINPVEIIKHSVNISANLAYTKTPAMFILVFTVFMYSVYKTVSVLLGREVES